MPAAFQRKRKEPEDLWAEFEKQIKNLGGQMLPEGAFPLLLDRGFWADEDVLDLLPANGHRAESVWEAEVGVCLADLAIAETGALVVSAGPGRARLTSLAPPVNLVLIREDDIVNTPEQAFSQIPSTTTVIIAGTSRTADIEGVLVRGVHGPRELYVVKI
jgi:L-lactate utilization protein LutC